MEQELIYWPQEDYNEDYRDNDYFIYEDDYPEFSADDFLDY